MMDWEDSYQRGEAPWDLDGAAPPLAQMLAERPAELWGGGPILVPGCGKGHDVSALAEAGHEVLGLDLAPTALAEAARRYGSSASLRWLEGDFFDSELAAANPVGAIWEHTCFCAISPEQRGAYVEAAARWLNPRGVLVALFFLNPPQWEAGEEGPPWGADREEIRGLFGSEFTIVKEEVPLGSDPSRAGREWLVEMVRTH